MKALVFFLLIILGMAIFLGMLVNGTEALSPLRGAQQAYAYGTMAAIQANGTLADFSATQTPRVAKAQAAQTKEALPAAIKQTSQAQQAQATQAAFQATATVGAAQAALLQIGFEATKSKLDEDKWMEDQMRRATIEVINQAKEQEADNARNEAQSATYNQIIQILLVILMGLAIVLLSAWMILKLAGWKLNRQEDPAPVKHKS